MIRLVRFYINSFSGDVKTIAGGTKGFRDGKKLHAQFYYPSQLVIDGLGQYVYIADHVSEL